MLGIVANVQPAYLCFRCAFVLGGTQFRPLEVFKCLTALYVYHELSLQTDGNIFHSLKGITKFQRHKTQPSIAFLPVYSRRDTQ